MKGSELIKIIRSPHVTEKSSVLGGLSKYVFEVAKSASKPLIAKAVEELFAVKVASVRTMNVCGKTRRFRGRAGKCSNWKKAYVTLAEGSSINFSNI